LHQQPMLTPPMQGQNPLTGPLNSGAGSHPLTSGEKREHSLKSGATTHKRVGRHKVLHQR
ncbi:hypothetical protein T11_15402, partial [Trichinella zimbabwensis]